MDNKEETWSYYDNTILDLVKYYAKRLMKCMISNSHTFIRNIVKVIFKIKNIQEGLVL